MTSKKIVGETPNGGAYSVIHYFDEKGNSTTEDKAKTCIIGEYDKDDNLIQETHGICN